MKHRAPVEKVERFGDLVEKAEPKTDSKILLFKTDQCPNCALAAKQLDQFKIDFQIVDATKEKDLVDKYDVMQVPVLVDLRGDEPVICRGVSEIYGWLKS